MVLINNEYNKMSTLVLMEILIKKTKTKLKMKPLISVGIECLVLKVRYLN